MTAEPEFSRLIAVEGITPDKTRKESIAAKGDECKALAARFDIKSLSVLKADMEIRRVSEGKIVKIEGRVVADIIQSCVVSLQDVPSHVDVSFDTYFTEDAVLAKEDDAYDPLRDEEYPEIIVNGMIDMGELAAQYLSLEIDPYPRAPGVSLAAQQAASGEKPKNNPFQVLEAIQTGKKET